MKKLFLFQHGKILLREDGRLISGSDNAGLAEMFVNSGIVDRKTPDGDQWAELDPDAALPAGYALFERRTVWNLVGEEVFFRIGKAFHIMDWQRSHKFCGLCGGRNHYDEAEAALRCDSCGELTFPVICPAIIVSVVKDGKLLMGHNTNFPKGRYSVLAGFAEPGESLEDCVRREISEEAGIEVGDIRYFGSQPWPFPHSLMVGFTAEWQGGEITPDGSELLDVGWYAADEIPEYYRGISISARLIENFIKNYS